MSDVSSENTNEKQQLSAPAQVMQAHESSSKMYEESNEQSVGDGANSSNKRSALAGQWRTPPTMLFFPGMGSEQHQQQQQHQVPGSEAKHEQQQPPNQQLQQPQTVQHTAQQQPHLLQPQYEGQQQSLQYSQQQTGMRIDSQSALNMNPINSSPHVGASVTMAAPISGIPSIDGSVSTTHNMVPMQQPVTSSSASVVFSGVPVPIVTSIPHSTEDYAKALQEAYRRGAEAAAMAAAAQVMRGEGAALSNIASHPNLPNLVSAVSCPDFSIQHQQPTLSQQAPQLVAAAPQTTQTYVPVHPQNTGGTVVPMSIVPNQVKPNTYHTAAPTPSDASSVLMPPPAPVTSSVPDPIPFQHTPTIVSTQPPASHSGQMMMLQQPPQPQMPQPAIDTTPQHQNQYQQQRSVSLPDMSSYAAQQEEEKRQKRLARNRASARLRRLRKKNLVDAYEIEVGILEKTLQMLQEHEWGDDKNSGNHEGRASALAAALSMDRGQQQLTVEERKQAASDILQQQLLFLEQLENLLQEQFILHEVARIQLNPTINNTEVKDDRFEDLQQILQLTDEQARQLQQAATNWEEEWCALQTVKASLLDMKENDWLWNDGCIETADQFLRILHKNQISKFLLWCDHNIEAIDELDCVNAPSVDGSTLHGPIFSFGVDSHPGEFLDDEK